MTPLEKLASFGAPPIRPAAVDDDLLRRRFGSVAEQLQVVLARKNGYYAFENALHIFSDRGNDREPGIADWNSDDSWRSAYEGAADGAVFFAEDVFGTQFCLREGVVATFDPETARFEVMGLSIEDWAKQVIADPDYWSGRPVAREWQSRHGVLVPGTRLLPVTPFTLGGDYSSANVRRSDAILGMRYRASLALQIRNLPDGATVSLKVTD